MVSKSRRIEEVFELIRGLRPPAPTSCWSESPAPARNLRRGPSTGSVRGDEPFAARSHQRHPRRSPGIDPVRPRQGRVRGCDRTARDSSRPPTRAPCFSTRWAPSGRRPDQTAAGYAGRSARSAASAASRRRKVDTRLVVAANSDPLAVQSAEFREDLYYRLNVISDRATPAARERRDDIPLFATTFSTSTPRRTNATCGAVVGSDGRTARVVTGRATCASSKTRSSGQAEYIDQRVAAGGAR